MFNKIFDWLLKSSADPAAVALTAKGLTTTALSFAMVFVHNPNLATLPDDVYSLIVALFAVYSALALVFGLARKIYLTFVV